MPAYTVAVTMFEVGATSLVHVENETAAAAKEDVDGVVGYDGYGVTAVFEGHIVPVISGGSQMRTIPPDEFAAWREEAARVRAEEDAAKAARAEAAARKEAGAPAAVEAPAPRRRQRPSWDSGDDAIPY